MKKWFVFGLVAAMLLACEAKLPEFAGVYILQSGKYKEVTRIKDLKPTPFNHQQRSGFFGGTDCNVKNIINKEQFIPIDQEDFNKRGFTVVQNKEWSDFKFYRVPTEGFLKDNEKGNEIILSIYYGCGMMGMPFSLQGLHEKTDLKEIELKQAKKGENAFIYIPTKPLEKGYYLIDYKLNGQSIVGFNPIVVK